MANGQSGYYLGSDVRKSGGDLQDLWGGSLDQQAGINKYRGIGRGLGALGGILLAGSGAGIPLLALAGGLGSLGGSLLGGALGKHKYGAPVKAEKGGLFHRDVAKEQRQSVDDYWKGMKEQIAVNTLQDAVTAGMYGSQVQDIAGKFKDLPSQLAGKAADLGFDKTAIRLGGTPKGMGVPSAPPALKQANLSGTIFDQTKSQLAPQITGGVYPSAANAALSKSGGGLVDLVSGPTDIAPNLLGTGQIGGTGTGIDTTANIAAGIDAMPIESTAVESLEQRLGSGSLGAVSPSGAYTGTYEQNIGLFKDYPQMQGKPFAERKKFWESLFPNQADLNTNYDQAINRASAMQAGGLKVPDTLNQFQFAGQQGSYLSDAMNRSGIDSSMLGSQAQDAYWGDIYEGAPWRVWENK